MSVCLIFKFCNLQVVPTRSISRISDGAVVARDVDDNSQKSIGLVRVLGPGGRNPREIVAVVGHLDDNIKRRVVLVGWSLLSPLHAAVFALDIRALVVLDSNIGNVVLHVTFVVLLC